jgi:hypothetical protein
MLPMRSLSALAVVFLAGAAHASLFSFHYTVGGADVDLQLTAENAFGVPGLYLVTDIVGVRAGAPVTFFQPGGPGDFYSDDRYYLLDNLMSTDEFAPNHAVFSTEGFEIGTRDGRFNFCLNTSTPTIEYEEFKDGTSPVGVSNVVLTPVPEPTSCAALGLGTLAFLRRRGRRRA